MATYKTEKKQKMKVWKKVLILFLMIPVVAVVALTGLYLYADNRPDIRKGYNEQIASGGEIEATYLKTGNYETKKVTERAESPIGKYTIYYPAELETSNKRYPMILVVNGTGGKATKNEPEFDLYASWGFIVVGTQDKGTGSGKTTVETLNYMLNQNNEENSIFYQKVDTENIGPTGFSQGGAAVFNVLTKYEESKYIKTAVPLSPVSESTAQQMTDYPYDSSKVACPILLLAGTEGEFETEIVIPIDAMNAMYDKISSPKIMARRVDTIHDRMAYSAGGYVIAWFRWQLQGDTYAANAFIGETPELQTNSMYQDQRFDYEVNEE